MTQFISHILSSTIALIGSSGYIGIIIAMTIESACIPLPSEIIMPFGGYLAGQGLLNIHLVALCGATGNLIGSLIVYSLGRKSGHFLLQKIEKMKHVNQKHLADTMKFFNKHGAAGVFFARMIPGIRTFISLPAGILEVPLKKFIIYTFVGSYIWCYLLGFIGYKLGKNWNHLIASTSSLHKVIIIILILVFGGLLAYLFTSKDKQQNPGT